MERWALHVPIYDLQLTFVKVSWHFRGPMHIKQFAFYSPGSSPTKRDSTRPTIHERRGSKDLGHHQHQHAHLHKHKRDRHAGHVHHADVEKRDPGSWVTATIDGQVVSWANNWGGSPTSAAAAVASPSATAATPDDSNARYGAYSAQGAYSAHSAPSAYSAPNAAPTVSAGSGSWGRQAYYNAEQGLADGLVFLNNRGGGGWDGAGSGVFD